MTVRWRGRRQRAAHGRRRAVLRRRGRRGPRRPRPAELLSCRRQADSVVAAWRANAGGRSVEFTYALRLWQKSLVVDVMCRAALVGRSPLRPGRGRRESPAGHAPLPDRATPSGRPCWSPGRPRSRCSSSPWSIIAARTPRRCGRSTHVAREACTTTAAPATCPRPTAAATIASSGCSSPSRRVSRKCLPNIPNPKSPWMHVAGERLWRAHGATSASTT